MASHYPHTPSHGAWLDYAQYQKQAVRSANLELLILLVAQGGPAIDMQDFGHLAWDIMRDRSPAMRETLRYLITTYGLSPDVTFPAYPGSHQHANLLQRACDELNLEAVELLLQHGADVQCPGLDQTALEYLTHKTGTRPMSTSAYATHYMPLVHLLLERGCPDIKGLDFSKRKYRHPAVPPAQSVTITSLADNYAWPGKEIPTDSARDHIPWVEETGTAFIHGALPDGQIRLLELCPSATPSDPVECNILFTPISEAPDYEILSIASDSALATLPITLNGSSLEVSPAVWDALHRVRQSDRPRLLWIKAVCVDHDNEAELLSHAQLYEAIYRRATKALAWLGAADKNSQLVFQHLDKCRAARQLNWSHYRGTTQDAFHKLCQRPWFYQVDSALVVGCSRDTTILCGADSECQFAELLRCTSFRQDYHPLHGIYGPNQLQNLKAVADRSGLRQAMQFARLCQDTCEKEKIRAISSIVGQYEFLSDSSSSDLELATSFTRHSILTERDISLLHFVGAGSSRLDGAPSWVASFCSQQGAPALLPRVFGSYSYSSEHYPWKLLSEPEIRRSGELALKGVLCGKVQAVGESLTPIFPEMAPGSKAFRKVIRSWEVVCTSHLSNNGRKKFPQSVADAFADTIRAFDDHEQVGESRPAITSRACDFVEWYKQYGSGVMYSKEAAYFDEIETVQAWQNQAKAANGDGTSRVGCSTFTEAVERAIYGRRLFVTDDGSMGLAPAKSKAGDRLVFFPGGIYPWVIRPRADGRTHELIGDCYLYDFRVVEIFRALIPSAIREVILS
ncbi:heterokaryon incompatibility protein-domain-containing protein [Microdochium trichocladiopsis]|uniref:Heterokaryon incompatibility protein-domain-containing protein n=1 Tax=Microdochium trichocladiopsis TaxID=1682393 RepID=A0A9P8YDL2_9PEZI|nr:heterokaryon incompatibility protein-domain-containing protein [Microdochium trichocladiopsis]KAH7039857.1 heterokaryon incompatibility protein-domain-containing protein [Microdochium trichocladiopsis]